MANASIQVIGGKNVLLLNETSGSGTVNLSLKKGSPVAGQDYYAGILEWDGQSVDVIDAHFTNESGNTGDIGPVQAAITLGDDGNTYTGLATAKETGTEGFEYVSQALSEGNTTLTLQYAEPPQNSDTGAIEMFFHTAQGVIDPGDEVNRDPG